MTTEKTAENNNSPASVKNVADIMNELKKIFNTLVHCASTNLNISDLLDDKNFKKLLLEFFKATDELKKFFELLLKVVTDLQNRLSVLKLQISLATL